MKAYLNTNNIISREHIVMASVSQNNENTEIKILGKSFIINKSKIAQPLAETLLYIFMPYKLRTCTEIIIKCEDIFTDYF